MLATAALKRFIALTVEFGIGLEPAGWYSLSTSWIRARAARSNSRLASMEFKGDDPIAHYGAGNVGFFSPLR